MARRDNFIYPAGLRFGRLTISEYAGKDAHGKKLYRCLCDCGKETTAYASSLRNGQKQSCGCLRDETNRLPSFFRHGHTSNYKITPTYRSWQSMITRCTNPKHEAWARYGGKGITICARWIGDDGFQNFLSDMGERPEGLTLDRKDNNGDYTPANCRWSTPTEQARGSLKLTIDQVEQNSA
jgi:hypothetical protein